MTSLSGRSAASQLTRDPQSLHFGTKLPSPKLALASLPCFRCLNFKTPSKIARLADPKPDVDTDSPNLPWADRMVHTKGI